MTDAWAVPLVAIAWTKVSVFATSIYLHRALAHRSLRLHPVGERVTGGESLHNNHHAYPRSAKFSIRRWEFDPAWPIIRLLAATGLLVILGSPIAYPRATARRSIHPPFIAPR